MGTKAARLKDKYMRDALTKIRQTDLVGRYGHQEITMKCLVYLEQVLLFTLKTHQMLRLIEILLIRLSDLVKEGRICSR